ncbi:helix-turn-helix transcriptional regulator [Clostridium botulinum]
MKYEFIGDRIRALRKERGEKQELIALKINKKRNTVSEYENGCKYPNIFTVIELARYFNVSTDYLLAFVDEKYDSKDDKFIRLIKEFLKMTNEEKEELIKLAEKIVIKR